MILSAGRQIWIDLRQLHLLHLIPLDLGFGVALLAGSGWWAVIGWWGSWDRGKPLAGDGGHNDDDDVVAPIHSLESLLRSR